jgi:hypothetical protein
MVLQGHDMRDRYNAVLSMETLADAVKRIFWAFTVAEAEPTMDIDAEIAEAAMSAQRAPGRA